MEGPKEVKAGSAEAKPGRARQIMLAPGLAIMQVVTNAFAEVARAALGARKAIAEVAFVPAVSGKTPKNPITISKGKHSGSLAIKVSLGKGSDAYRVADLLALRIIRSVLYELKGGTPTPEDVANAELAAKGHITPEVVKMADEVIREAIDKAQKQAFIRARFGGHEVRIGKGPKGEATYRFLQIMAAATQAAIMGSGCACETCKALQEVKGIEVWDAKAKAFVPAPASFDEAKALAIVPVSAEVENAPVAAGAAN